MTQIFDSACPLCGLGAPSAACRRTAAARRRANKRATVRFILPAAPETTAVGEPRVEPVTDFRPHREAL